MVDDDEFLFLGLHSFFCPFPVFIGLFVCEFIWLTSILQTPLGTSG